MNSGQPKNEVLSAEFWVLSEDSWQSAVGSRKA